MTLITVGYGIITVPTGIVTAELSRANHPIFKQCEACDLETRFCKRCGTTL